MERELPYEDSFFDVIYMGELIEHLNNFRSSLSEIKRVMKDDAIFILDTPNAYSLIRLLKWMLKREEHLGDPTHLLLFTPGSLKATLEINGFELVELVEKPDKRFSWFPKSLKRGMGGYLLVAARKKST